MTDPTLDPAVRDNIPPRTGGVVDAFDIDDVENEIGRDPNAERDADHYGPGAGGKKRKVPTFQPSGDTSYHHRRDAGTSSSSSTTDGGQSRVYHVPNHSPRSAAAHNCSFRKALYLRRKAALITLYIDAQNAIISGATKLGPNGESPLMDVPAFEKLMVSLEDLGISDWPPDRPSWRNNWHNDDDNDAARTKSRVKTLEQWRTGFDKRRKAKEAFKPITNAGWFPEGSFEFEVPSKASDAARARVKDEAALHKLVNDLRAIALTAKPAPKPPTTVVSSDKPPAKSARTSTKRLDAAPPSQVRDPIPLSQTPSKESDSKLKSKKKKKKRSVLANQGNPHHVDNYRPSRKAAAYIDPYEPYPHHESLLFPPPMRLLAAVPQRRTAPLPGAPSELRPVRPAEDDFICCFCEIDLFFSSEKARRRAIRRLKQERRRKEQIRTKAKDVADGKGTAKDEESEYDDDEEWCGDEDGHGRCTCGRQISEPHRSVKSRLKPPETDPPHDHHHHHYDDDDDDDEHHDHHHHHYDHDHDHGHDHHHDHDDHYHDHDHADDFHHGDHHQHHHQPQHTHSSHSRDPSLD